jgi:hypothetical protein
VDRTGQQCIPLTTPHNEVKRSTLPDQDKGDKTLIRSRSKVWTLSQAVEKMLNVLERKVLKKIYGPVFVYGQWQNKYNHEIYKLYE